MKNKLKITSTVRYGSYSLIVMAVVLAILIFINLAVGALPSTVTSITDKDSEIYSISDTSKEYMKKLDQKVTVYVVSVEGSSTEHHLMINEYVKKYCALSDNVTVKYVDPVLRPGFMAEYNKDGALTEDELSPDYTHIVVESDKRSKIIPYTDIFTYALSGDDLTAFYYTYGYVPYSFNIENCLISAIDYVTVELLPTIYYTTGHGETTLDDGFTTFAKLDNIAIKSIDLSKVDAVHEDAHAIIIYSPKNDFSEIEISRLKEFSERGGNIILATDYNVSLSDRIFENLYTFTSEHYGLSYIDALVFEGDTSKIYGYNEYILATMTSSAPELIKAEAGYALFTYAHAIEVSSELPEGVTVKTMFTTTSKGYAKADFGKDSVREKEEGDLEGAFNLGLTSDRGDSTLWWFASTDALNTSMNPYIVIYALAESVEKESAVSAAAVVITHDMLEISDQAADLWSWILIGIIPGAILAYGIYIRYRRSRR